jgi:hypothetical protein
MNIKIATLAIALALVGPTISLASPAAWTGARVVADMTSPAAISGRVVDSRTDTPLAGVKVSAFPLGSTTAEATAMTDNQGQFTLNGLRGGDYRLLFERSGYPRALAAGIGVKPHDHLVLVGAFALQVNPRVGQSRPLDPCSSLLQPGEVADVYVICSGH